MVSLSKAPSALKARGLFYVVPVVLWRGVLYIWASLEVRMSNVPRGYPVTTLDEAHECAEVLNRPLLVNLPDGRVGRMSPGGKFSDLTAKVNRVEAILSRGEQLEIPDAKKGDGSKSR